MNDHGRPIPQFLRDKINGPADLDELQRQLMPPPVVAATVTRPPHTEDLTRALEHWHEVHTRSQQLQAENDRLSADNEVLRHRIEWTESHNVEITAQLEMHRAANVAITTELNNIAVIFTGAIERVRLAPFAPQSKTLIPDAAKEAAAKDGVA